MEIRSYILGQGNIGWLIALIVLILSVVFWAVGGLTMPMVLLLVALLALSRLL